MCFGWNGEGPAVCGAEYDRSGPEYKAEREIAEKHIKREAKEETMDITKLKAQYEGWKYDREIENPSEEFLWAFLSEYGLLKEDPAVPADTHKPISVLSVTLYTDGDFRCGLNHPKLVYDDYQRYNLFVSWSGEEAAVKEAWSFCIA